MAAKSSSTANNKLAACKTLASKLGPFISARTLPAVLSQHSRQGGLPLESSDRQNLALIIDDCGAFASPHTPQARVIRERGRPPRRHRKPARRVPLALSPRESFRLQGAVFELANRKPRAQKERDSSLAAEIGTWAAEVHRSTSAQLRRT